MRRFTYRRKRVSKISRKRKQRGGIPAPNTIWEACALGINNYNRLKELLESGANPNQTFGSEKETALIPAIKGRVPEYIRLLLEYGTNPNIPDYYGLTPIHYAASTFKMKTDEEYEKSVEILFLLLNAGADPNIQAGFLKQTPVQMLVHERSRLSYSLQPDLSNVFELFWEFGADFNLTDTSGMRLGDMFALTEQERETILELLQVSPNNLALKNVPNFGPGATMKRCFNPIMANNEDITPEHTTFYIVESSGRVGNISCLDADALYQYQTSSDYLVHQCTRNTDPHTGGLPMSSLHVTHDHIIGVPLRRLELAQKVYVRDEEFQQVAPGKAYLLEPTNVELGRIVSETFMRTESAVSADHCQTVFKDPIYAIYEAFTPEKMGERLQKLYDGGKRRK